MPSCGAAFSRRWAAPARRRRAWPRTCRSSATAPRISCRSKRWSPCRPTRITHYLFDGANKLFCPLAIGEVEARLDRARFMRVHRSHIINIERVTGTRRAGDSELVELAGDTRSTVPVSRSRAGSLKSRIRQKNAKPGATGG